MNHMKQMAVKFLASLGLLYLILGIGYDMSFGNVFLISLVLGILSYIVGDILILPRTNNFVASIADFGLAYIVIYSMSGALTVGGDLFTASLIASVGVTVFEVFFHNYLEAKYGYNEAQREPHANKLNFQTETAEELYPEDDEEPEK